MGGDAYSGRDVAQPHAQVMAIAARIRKLHSATPARYQWAFLECLC